VVEGDHLGAGGRERTEELRPVCGDLHPPVDRREDRAVVMQWCAFGVVLITGEHDASIAHDEVEGFHDAEYFAFHGVELVEFEFDDVFPSFDDDTVDDAFPSEPGG
jgi:hypothetical protein